MGDYELLSKIKSPADVKGLMKKTWRNYAVKYEKN